MRSSTRRRIGIGLVVVIVTLAALIGGGMLWVWGRVMASLPALDGEVAVEGLSAPVTITRDALGVPTIRGESREDVARALGFLHGQERFFQMDLMRRSAAGELAEIIGPPVMGTDRVVRFHRFRHRASLVIEAGTDEQRRNIDAYTDGVNAGLRALGNHPFEYLLLGTDPEPWTPEDTVLVIYAMFLDLDDETGSHEATEGVMFDVLGWEMASFLAPAGCEWDAPVEGSPWPTPPVPGPRVMDLRGREPMSRLTPFPPSTPRPRGSNNWVVAGSRTAHGGAILASDMHLGISVPNIWYRATMEWPSSRGGTSRLTGVTLPGTPAIVAGSNTHVAWGFTNTEGDWVDLVIVETDPRDPSRYLTPDGYQPFEQVEERIDVKDEEPLMLRIRSTIWGPVTGRDHKGQLRALRWTAHDTEGVNMNIMALEEARNVEEVLWHAPTIGIPPQNIVTADRDGRIGWTIAGRIPRRTGFDGRLPSWWGEGSRGWSGWVAREDYPRIEDPDQGVIWTANGRVVDGEPLALIGISGYSLGARAKQIRDALADLDVATESDLLAIQLDDRAILLSRWRDLLLEILDDEALEQNLGRQEFRRLLEETWTGHASVDSVAYTLVRSFRLIAFDTVYTWLTAPCREADPTFDFHHITQWEGPLWKLLTERPEHLLDPRYGTWKEALLDVVDLTVESLPHPLSEQSWGERNTARIQHPLSLAVPALGRWLDMPADPLPGDSHMPRVLSPDSGASERFVVSPGREHSGIFHMPCGQSGHPLSPHYKAGHDDWIEGRPTPLLPGPTASTLTLVPSPHS